MKYRRTSAVVALLLIVCGCENKTTHSVAQPKTNLVDSSITEFHNLGWVGAMIHPLTEIVSFVDPDDPEASVSPGGLVIREVIDASPAAAAGLQIGDVIVGVGDDWVPIKDDPTLDVIELIELQVTAAEPTTDLKVYRNGKCETVSLKNVSNSLEGGLPNQVVRLSDAASRGLNYLAEQQNENGSFGAADASPESRLQSTAIAGLALLATGDEKFTANVDQCKQFIGGEIDALIASAADDEPEKEETEAKPGVVMMKMPSFEMEPLTAAYVLQFLAEAKIPMMDQQWMPRLFGTIGGLSKTQHDSGGWNVTSVAESNDAEPGDVDESNKTEESDDSETAIDVAGTHTTNQVLLALGMLERTGMMGQPEIMIKACGYLKDQKAARSGGGIDRRLRATLSAGTGVAFVAINCQKTDSFLKDAMTDGLEKLGERYSSPNLAMSGLLSAGILAKQAGKDGWAQFHNETKYWLSSIQRPDGSFQSIPGTNGSPLAIESNSSDPIWSAAHYCLLLATQSTELKTLVGETKSPMMFARDSSGKKVEGGDETAAATPAGMPAGAQMIQLDLGDIEGGDIQEAIRKKLEEQGIEIGDAEISGLDSLPGGDKKKEKKK